jgi:hypothetical protein
LLDWVSEKCGIDVTDFILPYFEYFFSSNCFEILKQARNLKNFYAEKEIDYVITHTSSDMTSKAAIVASRLYGKTKTVCIQHCSDVFEDRVFHITEVDAFDYYFTMDSISEIRFKRYAAVDYVSPCEIYQSPHFLKEVKKHCLKRERRRPGEPKRILYIPTKLAAVHTRYFNCMVYPILWFLEYQRKLFQFFAKEKDYLFIYKQPILRRTFVEKTVLPLLQGIPNIKIETRPVMDCFSLADAVIMDRPTTAFYEAQMSGLPVLALYPDFIGNMIAKDACAFFGKSVQSFSTPEEAFQKITEFLNGNPSDYTSELPLRDDNMARVLKDKLPDRPASFSGVSRQPAPAAF